MPSSIEQIIVTKYRGGLVFFNESSYSMQALRYVQRTASVDMAEPRIAQRYALACIYFATNAISTPFTDVVLLGRNESSQARNSTVLYEWLRPWATGSLADHECEWPGVVCNHEDVVTELHLAQNWMTGTFPIEVILLKETLTVLDLEDNLLCNLGYSNVWWLGELTQLRILNLGNNAFSNGHEGGLPVSLGNLIHLRQLVLYSTFFEGALNSHIFSSMTHLEYLDLGAMPLVQRQFPDSLRHLSNLKYLYLDYSNIADDLNALFGDDSAVSFPNLVELWADQSPLLHASTIPTTIGRLSNLRSLSLTSCGLTGSIPTEIGRLTSLTQLWLSNNDLNGTVPVELSSLPSLQKIDLHNNTHLLCDNPRDPTSSLNCQLEDP